ncbi:hypothetical protein L7F22_028050 [Adiantum nelumboides]|nr:hypothetical protein [Adiantum nelumboides]
MGAGGRMSLTSKELGHRAPHEKPPFLVGQLKKAVPPHCFNRSLIKSSSYLLVDLVVAGSLLYATKFITSLGVLGWIAWILYWIVQGCVLTGVWVIAHECGHHAFSDYSLVDDVVGLVLHSCLLVPYFSWKYSHRRHHSNIGSMSRDEVFVPKTKENLGFSAFFLSTPVGRLLSIIITLTLWWPMYLAFNVLGYSYDRFASHYDPKGPIFNSRERVQVLISDLSLVAVGLGLSWLASAYGLLWLLKVYAVPLLIVNGFFVRAGMRSHQGVASSPPYRSSSMAMGR